MPESHEPRTILDAAERAAAEGDYASAEELLREAARLQAADFGPLHPELANTLNNLGIVCEITNKPEDAELCYRKADAIATAVLEPDHPYAVTSRKNLTDFCESRGTPVERPTVRPAGATARPFQIVDALRSKVRSFSAVSLWSAFKEFSLPFRIVVLSLSGLVLLMIAAGSPWRHATESAEASPATASPMLPRSTAPENQPGAPIVDRDVAAITRGRATMTRGRAAATSAPAPTLASAGLCRDLSTRGNPASADWRCTAPRRPVDSGPLFFYTRLKSATETTVQHRWYRDGRLYQAVDLRVGANPRDGYRTYSRYTMTRDAGGAWRVEIRSKDGALLHEERFFVR